MLRPHHILPLFLIGTASLVLSGCAKPRPDPRLDAPLVRVATIGNAGARSALAHPIVGALRFAGEATAPTGYGCIEGAWQSGVDAAMPA